MHSKSTQTSAKRRSSRKRLGAANSKMRRHKELKISIETMDQMTKIKMKNLRSSLAQNAKMKKIKRKRMDLMQTEREFNDSRLRLFKFCPDIRSKLIEFLEDSFEQISVERMSKLSVTVSIAFTVRNFYANESHIDEVEQWMSPGAELKLRSDLLGYANENNSLCWMCAAISMFKCEYFITPQFIGYAHAVLSRPATQRNQLLFAFCYHFVSAMKSSNPSQTVYALAKSIKEAWNSYHSHCKIGKRLKDEMSAAPALGLRHNWDERGGNAIVVRNKIHFLFGQLLPQDADYKMWNAEEDTEDDSHFGALLSNVCEHSLRVRVKYRKQTVILLSVDSSKIMEIAKTLKQMRLFPFVTRILLTVQFIGPDGGPHVLALNRQPNSWLFVDDEKHKQILNKYAFDSINNLQRVESAYKRWKWQRFHEEVKDVMICGVRLELT